MIFSSSITLVKNVDVLIMSKTDVQQLKVVSEIVLWNAYNAYAQNRNLRVFWHDNFFSFYQIFTYYNFFILEITSVYLQQVNHLYFDRDLSTGTRLDCIA